MRIQKADQSQDTTVLFFQKKGVSPETQAARQELSELLGVPRDRNQMRVSYGLIPGADDELALLTRSMLQILVQLATHVEVPPEHIADGRTVPTIATAGSKEESRKLMNIQIVQPVPEPRRSSVCEENPLVLWCGAWRTAGQRKE